MTILTSELALNLVAILIGVSASMACSGGVLFLLLLRQHLRGRRRADP